MRRPHSSHVSLPGCRAIPHGGRFRSTSLQGVSRMNHRMYRTHAAFMAATALLAPPDSYTEGVTARTEARKRFVDGADPYARPGMDWNRFATTFATWLGERANKDTHIGRLLDAELTAFDRE